MPVKSRRDFIKISGVGSIFFMGLPKIFSGKNPADASGPIVISTWSHGIPANTAAWEILSKGGRALDAVEAGVRIPEADPKITSVGYGGLPDRDGKVTLDACIMDENSGCGSVAFLEHIMHPISVARLVMEKTPHVMIVGEGALKSATSTGVGEEVIRICGSHLVVELMRQGKSPEDACRIAVERIVKNQPKKSKEIQVGFLALNKHGEFGSYCLQKGFNYAVRSALHKDVLMDAKSYY